MRDCPVIFIVNSTGAASVPKQRPLPVNLLFFFFPSFLSDNCHDACKNQDTASGQNSQESFKAVSAFHLRRTVAGRTGIPAVSIFLKLLSLFPAAPGIGIR